MKMSSTTSEYEEFFETRESFASEDEDKAASDMGINIENSAMVKFGNNLKVWDMEYHFEFKEYPRTSETGVATIFNVSGWNADKARKIFKLRNIQYSLGDPGKMSNIKKHPFLGTSCKREFRTCQGVKICKFASAQILEGEHTVSNFEDEYYKELFDQGEYNSREFALCQFIAAHKSACGFINPDTNEHCIGKPVLKRHKNLSLYIGCSNWSNLQSGHRYIPISDTRTDRRYLEELFEDFEFCPVEEFDQRNDLDLSQIKRCNTILHFSSKQTTCRFSHLIGNIVVEAPIITQKCNVKFNSFTPENFEDSPFIAIVSKGIHNHLPPPPVTTPTNVLEQLNEIIKRHNVVDVTPRRFLAGTILRMYLNNFTTMHDSHFSLNNSTKLNYYIKKQRRLQYPYGSDLMSVVHELLRQQGENSYIRNIHIFDDGKTFVLCMSKQQSEQFQNLKYLEMTSTNNNAMKEWEITSYGENTNKCNKSLTFARVFTNVESSDAYKHIFHEIFSTLEKDSGKAIEFSYLNPSSNGISCIEVDYYKEQIIGLGKFLHERYPSMPAEEHLQHIYKICSVQYVRNIDNLKNVPDRIKDIMKAIPNCKTQIEIEKAFEDIENCESEVAKGWLNDQRTPWILSGISPIYTKIPSEIWNDLHNRFFAGSAHQDMGIDKTLPLLTAIKKAEKIDYREWNGVVASSSRQTVASSSRPTKKQRMQKSKDNLNATIQFDDIEMRQKWLNQEQQAIELLKQRVNLEKELLELKQKQNVMDTDV